MDQFLHLIVSALRIPVEQDLPSAYIEAAAGKLAIAPDTVTIVKILRKSLDIRDQRQFFYDLTVVVRVPHDYENGQRFEQYVEPAPIHSSSKPAGSRPVIIGFGPAGIFAALELIARGERPLIFERGKSLDERDKDVLQFINHRILTVESNIQFGEGGAGSYSDGKLFSRPSNSYVAQKVLDTFVAFGAPSEIRYVDKPHLGTDRLRTIVRAMREYILGHGGEIRFGAKMTGIIVEKGTAIGVMINDGEAYFTSRLYLAIGNSSRDTFEHLHESGIQLESRPLAVGVRIEHPVQVINRLRYGEKYQDYGGIGPATYSFTYTNRDVGRGAYTFCMCPGGEVVNASSENGALALNGMSYAARNSAFSNAGITVTCKPSDFGSAHPLAGIAFQRQIEQKAFAAGGCGWKIPAQNLTDFIDGHHSDSLLHCSARMGVESADLEVLFPSFIIEILRCAFAQWKKTSPLFVAETALVMGPETRTSSPVRIVRGENFQSVNVAHLFPIGEGSGYTGGIMSAAIDALKAVAAS